MKKGMRKARLKVCFAALLAVREIGGEKEEVVTPERNVEKLADSYSHFEKGEEQRNSAAAISASPRRRPGWGEKEGCPCQGVLSSSASPRGKEKKEGAIPASDLDRGIGSS